jgi:predicted nucleotidyltransferase component of viral defense system
MRLHENVTLFKEAITFTAQKFNIPEIYVEKDYWVMFALHTIFNHEIGKETVFKGGTALSKCFGMIERFSEDIDLVVLRKENESGNQLKTKLKKVTQTVAQQLEAVEVKGITHKKGMIRKIAYNYKKEFNGEFGQVRDVIIIEVTWLGRYEPYHNQSIHSYIYTMMQATKQLQIAEEYNMLPFEVQVLDVTRTICEKIMSLVRFSYGENALQDLKNKVRHTYDIHQLLQDKAIIAFFNSTNFDQMLLTVAQDDVESFKTDNSWLEHHPKEALIFSNLQPVWNELKETYNGSFKNLVFGELPSDNDVFNSLELVKKRLESIAWSVNL